MSGAVGTVLLILTNPSDLCGAALTGYKKAHWLRKAPLTSYLSSLTATQPPALITAFSTIMPAVRATLPSALNMMNAFSVGKLVQLVTASRLILYHEGQVDPMKDECHHQIKH